MQELLLRPFRRSLGDFFVRQVLKHRKKALITVAVLLGQAVAMVALPLPLKFLFDEIFIEGASPQMPGWLSPLMGDVSLWWLLTLTVLAWFFFYLSGSILDYLELIYSTKLANSLTESARREITDLLMTRHQTFFLSQSKADIIGRLSQDTLNMQLLVQTGMPVLARGIPGVIMVLGVFTALSNWYTTAALVKISLLAWVTYHYAQKIRESRRKVRQETTHFENNSLQFLNSFQTIKSQGFEGHVRKKSARFGRAVSHQTLHAANGQGLIVMVFSGSKGFFRFLVYLAGGYAVISGFETVGTIIVLTQYIEQIHYAMKDFYKFAYKSATSFASLDRLEEFMQTARQMPEPPSGPLTSLSQSPSVEFRNMSLWFDPQTPIVKDFSHHFSEGSINVIVGASGAGKSTLLCCLNRLLEPAEGEILMGGEALPRYNTRFLRHYVTYIPQESHIVRGSVRENLCFASQVELEDEELWPALRHVGAEEFVRQLPQGLDTVIGEAGFTLSGGQERKINLARALIPPPRGVYVFDEPTAGLDPLSAAVFMRHLSHLRSHGAIIFFSSHLTGEMAYADNILELKGQRVSVRPAKRNHRAENLDRPASL